MPNPSGAGADPGVPHLDYRKKPVVIQAVKYIGGGNVEPRGAVPDWLWEALASGTAYYTNGSDPLRLKTLEGTLTVSPGDWIIRGVKGELYPCKPDIFDATYEPAVAARLAAPADPGVLHMDELDLSPFKRRIEELREEGRLHVESWSAQGDSHQDGPEIDCPNCDAIFGECCALRDLVTEVERLRSAAAARLVGSPEEGTVLTSGVSSFTRASGDMTSIPPAGTLTQEQYPTKAEVAPGDGLAGLCEDCVDVALVLVCGRCGSQHVQQAEAGDGRAARLQAILGTLKTQVGSYVVADDPDMKTVRELCDEISALALGGQPEGQ